MAESPLHRTMKAVVRGELEGEGCAVMEEPLFPPSRRISWTAYRPDLVGYRRGKSGEEFTLVECETRPSTRKMYAKNWSTVSFQQFLFRDGSLRRVLAVPQGKLRGVDMALRRDWEIWVLGRTGVISRLPKMADPS